MSRVGMGGCGLNNGEEEQERLEMLEHLQQWKLKMKPIALEAAAVRAPVLAMHASLAR